MTILPNDIDGLRILGVGRIPRCPSCPRYQALVAAYEQTTILSPVLPEVPENCTFQVCAPLVSRFSRPRPAASARAAIDAASARAVAGL